MRLVDVDKLFKTLNKLEIPFYADINNVINSQPTAYNVDKVVEQLEDYKMWKELLIYDLDFRERQIIKRALEIVKAGVIDENKKDN